MIKRIIFIFGNLFLITTILLLLNQNLSYQSTIDAYREYTDSLEISIDLYQSEHESSLQTISDLHNENNVLNEENNQLSTQNANQAS